MKRILCVLLLSLMVSSAFAAKPLSHHTSKIIVVIDPGHGGKDPGAIGVQGHQEKTVALAVAQKLQKLINQQPGYRAYLTRTNDAFLSLRRRLAIARQHKANLFIALHADAYQKDCASGASVFALSERGATSEGARWLAEKENQSEFMGLIVHSRDKVVRSVLLDLSQHYTISTSLKMGQAILAQLKPVAGLHDRQVEQAAFVVLKSPDIPSLLIEMGYLSNPQQEQQLTQPDYQLKLAKAIWKGVEAYFVHYPNII
ncbi:MAG: N-acetylmuramoyl-L-alanine amidase [Gammaproteobacteria bacterium]